MVSRPGRRLLGEDDQGIALFDRGERLKEIPDDTDIHDTGRKDRRKPRVMERDGDGDSEDEDEGFVSADTDDEADFEALQRGPEPKRSGRKDKDREVDGDVATVAGGATNLDLAHQFLQLLPANLISFPAQAMRAYGLCHRTLEIAGQ